MIKLMWAAAAIFPLLAAAAWVLTPQRWKTSKRFRVVIALGVVTCGLWAWAFVIEPRSLVVRYVEVESQAWTGAPLRIGLVSDTHAGAPHVTPKRVSQVMAKLSAERPDVVFLLGDYAGGSQRASRRSAQERSVVLGGAAALGEARAPLGRYAVLGNHDWWYDGPVLERELQGAGITVLENQAVRVTRPGGAFWVAGLADLHSKRTAPSVVRALQPVRAGEPVVVLTHWPDPFSEVPGAVALTMAGHTHCGQVNLPFLGRTVHASLGSKRWGCGLYDEDGRKLFVTAGLGVSMLPVRFRAPPEIVVITLRARG